MNQIHAELELTECSGELWLNGIPLPGQPSRRPTFEISVPVNHLLVTGRNELELWVDVDGKPSESHRPRHAPASPAAIAVARLVAYAPGVMASPENGRVLAVLEYRGVGDGSVDAPRVRRLSVDLGMSFGPWAWQKAPVLTLDEPTLREAVAVVGEVHAALFGGDAARLFDLVRTRWEEADRAYPGRDDAADRSSHAAWVAELGRDPRRRVPLDPARHDFRLVAGGRMIECIDEDFFPAIRVAQEIEPGRWAAAPYPLSLARIGPRLSVVR